MEAAGEVVVQQRVTTQPQRSNEVWIHWMMTTQFIKIFLDCFDVREQQVEDGLRQLQQQGEGCSVDKLLHVIRHPGNLFANLVMASGNYTYLDVLAFLSQWNLVPNHQDTQPAVEQFHADYRIRKGTGIEQLQWDVERQTREIRRIHTRYQERIRMENEDRDTLRQACVALRHNCQVAEEERDAARSQLTETSNLLVNADNQLGIAVQARDAYKDRANMADKRAKAAEEEKNRMLATAEEEKNRMLATAEEEKNRMLATAEEEKNRMLATAEEEKNRMLATAEEEKNRMLSEIEKLKALLASQRS